MEKKQKWKRVVYQSEPHPAQSFVRRYAGTIRSGIVFRSGMELRLFKHMDARQNVLSWSSEETVIPYVSPLDNRLHRYFVDVKATILLNNGTTKTFLIEVKEKSQTKPPNPPKPGKKKTRFLKESVTYAVNSVKWETARKVCAKKCVS